MQDTQSQQYDASGATEKRTQEPAYPPPSQVTFWQFLWNEGNIRYLFATSACWFLLDFAFYGLGMNNPRQNAAIWRPSSQIANSTWPSSHNSSSYDNISNVTLPDWQNPFDPGTNFYGENFDDARQYVITVSIGSMLGSILLIVFINRQSRRRLLIQSFAVLSILFLATGIVLHYTEFEGAHWVTIILYMFCQFFFNFGPNSLTFIISAEIFPTKYRCTCYGISAASGKLGSIVVQLIMNGQPAFNRRPKYLAWLLISFAFLMALGGVIAWLWLPELQDRRTEAERKAHKKRNGRRGVKFISKKLEDLAVGWRTAHENGDVTRATEKLKSLFKVKKLVRENIESGPSGQTLRSNSRDGSQDGQSS
ncbi:hypothetical protein EG329_008806 [Mollisiaceae sp. DMI_Dod_QoI]|nr:hypothetical protein EG329_008806 [Helotiales sp. DMI_Dod_QoI]